MTDIDECREAALSSAVICTENDTRCINIDGDFECVCVSGYELVDEVCERKCCIFTWPVLTLTTLYYIHRNHGSCSSCEGGNSSDWGK